MILKWEDADNGYRDQNASTALVLHGYWSLGDDESYNQSWSIELIVQDDDLNNYEYLHHKSFDTEDQAKAYAQTIEDREASA